MADMNDKNKAQYPNLARALASCQAGKDPAIQHIDWIALNELLTQSYSFSPAMWLESHQWWAQSNHASFNSVAIWLLTDAEAWEQIDTSHNSTFLSIVALYQAGSFQRINAFRLLELLNSNHAFISLLSVLLNKSEYETLARFILTHLEDLISLNSFSSHNLLVMLNALDMLNYLFYNQQKLNLSDRFIANLINWLMINTDTQAAFSMLSYIDNMVSNQPTIIVTLNSFNNTQLINLFNHLETSPELLSPPLAENTHAISQQAAFLQSILEQVYQLNSEQIDSLSAAMDDIGIADDDTGFNPPSPAGSDQLNFIENLISEAANDEDEPSSLSHTFSASIVEVGSDGWLLLK